MITHLFAPTARRSEKHAANAAHYLRGLLSEIPRKNVERMAEAMEESSLQNLHNFIAEADWDHAALLTWAAQRANQRLGGHRDSMLILDESAFGKKGDKSVGVARQYNGRLGKVDNCQVGVFSVLGCGTRAAFAGARLHLPKEWTDDPERCRQAGVPEEAIAPRTKIDLAKELIEDALRQGFEFQLVAFDAFYGRDQKLLRWIADQGKTFVADIPCNLHVWAAPPPAPSGKARPGGTTVASWSETHCRPGTGATVTLRESENGPVKAEVWRRRVWLAGTADEAALECWHVVSRDCQGVLKHTLCNAPAGIALHRLAQHQGQRHFIERTFQDAKSHAGMAQYQCRGWAAWHRHMTMVALAIQFVLEEKLLLETTVPLLTIRDIVDILDWHLPRRASLESVVGQIRQRHQLRSRQKANAIRRAKKRPKLMAK